MSVDFRPEPERFRKAGGVELSVDSSGAAEQEIVCELTNRQKLFWLGQQLSGDQPVYNIAFVYEIQGLIDVDRFRDAFTQTICSSDALRVVVDEVEGVPVQRILPRLDYELEVFDLSDERDPDAAFRPWLDERLARSLPMGERLFDSALVKLAPKRFAWFLSQHHIITDGASMAILFERVGDAYASLAPDGLAPGQLRPASASDTDDRDRPSMDYPSYLQYVHRERELRESKTFERAEKYRLKKLAQELSPVRYYRDDPPKCSLFEDRRVLRVDRERADRLRAVATSEEMPTQREEQALFLVFSSLLATYVHQTSGNREIGLGMVFHNRLSEVDRRTAGLYVNLFPLQFEIASGETFQTMMQKSMTESFAAVRYGPYCISNPGRKRSYEILLNYLPMRYPDFAGMRTRIEWAHTGASDGHQSLSLHVHDFEGTGELSLVFDFNTGAFDSIEQERALRDFDALLDRFLDDSQGTIGGAAVREAKEDSPVAEPVAPAGLQATVGQRAPKNEVEADLVEIWEDLLGRSPIGVGDDFFDLGGHSLLAVSLVTRVEERLGVKLPLTSLFAQPTIRGLAAGIEPVRSRDSRPSEQSSEDVLIPVRAAGSLLPFFCVPGAGGYAFRLRNLSGYLGEDRPMYGFRPIVGETVESLEDAAAINIAALREVQPHGPYVLGGTCLGAMIAFEMAQQLTAAGEEVGSLSLINVQGELDYRFYRWAGGGLDRLYRRFGAEPPRLHRGVIEAVRLAKAARRGLRRESLRVQRLFSETARAAWEENWSHVGKEYSKHRAIGFEQTKLALSYRPRPYPGAIHLFLARRVRARRLFDERAEWRALASGGLHIQVVEGEHDTVLEEPNVASLAELLSQSFAG